MITFRVNIVFSSSSRAKAAQTEQSADAFASRISPAAINVKLYSRNEKRYAANRQFQVFAESVNLILDLAIRDQYRARDAPGEILVVGDHQNRFTFLNEPGEEIEHLVGRL